VCSYMVLSKLAINAINIIKLLLHAVSSMVHGDIESTLYIATVYTIVMLE